MTTTAKRGPGRPPKAENIAARAARQAVLDHKSQIAAEPSRRVVKAKYDAAGQGRRMAGWNPPSTGPNLATAGLQTIRNRARDSRRNDWSAESINTKWSTSLVGVGITPRFSRLSDTRSKAVTDIYNDFVRVADADGVLDLYGLQTLAVETWMDGGEAFIRKRPRFLDEGLPVPVQVQLIEADMCPLFDADVLTGLPQTSIIRQGIELNRKRNTRVAYWFYKEHPGDGSMGVIPSADMLVRVPASEVRHMFKPSRPGQLRGVPLIASVLARLRNIENYDDATLTRQQLANLIVGFVKQELPTLSADDIDGLTGEEQEISPEGTKLVGMQPGLIQSLGPGESMEWSNPPEAGTDYPAYMRTQHLGTAAAAGLPYEVFSGDIREVSDRTLRVVINEFRRLAEQRQWQIVIPMMCQAVIDWFAEAMVLAGLASVEEYDLIRRVDHAPHGWSHIHPVQDPQGKLLEIAGGLRSRSSTIGERGDDPKTVDAERAEDMAREKALGLWVDPDPNVTAGDDEDEDGIDNDEYSAPPNAQLELMQRAVAQMERQAGVIAQQGALLNDMKGEMDRLRAEASTSTVQDKMLALLGTTGAVQ